jgi:phosphate transport system substrate-binding protein
MSLRAIQAIIPALMIMAIMASSVANADTIVLQGSTTFARHLLKQDQRKKIETESGHALTVIPNKSTPGMLGLIEGRAQMAMISAPLATELAALAEAFPGLAVYQLKAHEIARVRISIVVNPANPVRKVTLDQLRKILNGEIKNWSELGGADLAIRAVLVGGGGGVTTVVEGVILGGQAPSAPNILYTKSPVQLVQIVEQEPGYLGFAQMELANQRHSPELKTDYEIDQVLSLVTIGEPTKAMQAVIDAARRVGL